MWSASLWQRAASECEGGMLATPAMEVVVEVEEVEVEEEGVVVLGHKVPAAVVRIVPTRHRSAQSGDIANAPPTRFAITRLLFVSAKNSCTKIQNGFAQR